MKAIVFGGSGFVGSYVADALTNDGYETQGKGDVDAQEHQKKHRCEQDQTKSPPFHLRIPPYQIASEKGG